jgi:hypothetical protein
MIHHLSDEMLATQKDLQKNQIENLTRLNDNLKELSSKFSKQIES